MNEIKFACPHCHQHIACDEGYCGYQIGCPACGGGMIVPKLASFGFGPGDNLSLALPVATPVPRQVASRASRGSLAAGNEVGWNPHAETEKVGESSGRGGVMMLLLFFAPALLALLFFNSVAGRGSGRVQWLWTLWLIVTPICSLLCAMGLSQTMSKNVAARILITIVLAPVIWGLNASISLFLGCVAGMMSAVANS